MLLFLLTLAAILMGGWVLLYLWHWCWKSSSISYRLEQENFIMVTFVLYFFPECNVTRSYRLPPQGLN